MPPATKYPAPAPAYKPEQPPKPTSYTKPYSTKDKHLVEYPPRGNQHYQPDPYHSDDLYITLELKRYSDYNSQFTHIGFHGYVLIVVEHGTQFLWYDLHGVDPKCADYSRHNIYSYYGCGIAIHEGMECSLPSKTFYDSTVVKHDPWKVAKYRADGHEAEGKDLKVYTGLSGKDIDGKSLVIYDYAGHAVACSPIVRVKLLYAPDLTRYPRAGGDDDDDFGAESGRCLAARFYIRTVDRHQVLSYKLHGVDTRCSKDFETTCSTCKKKKLADKACTIRIHEGDSCFLVGDSLWNKAELQEDPWDDVRYYADGNNAEADDVRVFTGLPMSKVIFRTVVVYDYKGRRTSCSKLHPVLKLVTPDLQLYPGSPTELVVKGDVAVTSLHGQQTLDYHLSDVDPLCADPFKDEGCGIEIYEGHDCAAVGNRLPFQPDVGGNPWTNSRYTTLSDQSTWGKNLVYTGWDIDDLLGRALVVHDFRGKPVACSVLLPPPYGRAEPVCEPDIHPPVEYGCPIKKDECFPADATIVRPGGMRVSLTDVQVGDAALVVRTTGEHAFEPILGMIHAAGAQTHSSSVIVRLEHEGGVFRATSNHLLFADGRDVAVGQVGVGQQIRFRNEEGEQQLKVFAVGTEPLVVPVVSPLTAAGTLVVDGIVSSVYASAGAVVVSHSAMHAAVYLVRAFPHVVSLLLRQLPAMHAIHARQHNGLRLAIRSS
eukprot:TRINITY_DN29_c0_g1_i4.p1 TRINITY_DN29_c0_g1~~TRINITY_DN29_c0_g1_i4.p1  ORF type:complete len:709 (+),score=67.71 TRINITY_DN29_c0_g1_i4:1079-3205(+)